MTLYYTTLKSENKRVKIAPFKNFLKVNGAFANRTKAGQYPVRQSLTIHNEKFFFEWPSAEHAYHAQKIIHMKRKLSSSNSHQQLLTAALMTIKDTKSGHNEEFSPAEYRTIVADLIAKTREPFSLD